MDNRQVIGRCSLCGGRVLQHPFLHIVGPFPQAECERCGAVEEGRGPIIPMQPRGATVRMTFDIDLRKAKPPGAQ